MKKAIKIIIFTPISIFLLMCIQEYLCLLLAGNRKEKENEDDNDFNFEEEYEFIDLDDDLDDDLD